MTFYTAKLSRAGGRAVNQDYCGHLELRDAACWVVADGLGGYQGGAAAARLAVEAALDSFRRDRRLTPEALAGHIRAAHAAVLGGQQGAPELQHMRTTIAVLVSDYRHFMCAHVGDSRLYYWRGGRLAYQSRDHSIPQALADAGHIRPDQIRRHEDRNRLRRSLGGDETPQPTTLRDKQPLYRGDAFLLCVDGFWEHVLEAEMEADLAQSTDPDAWLAAMESRLLGRAGPGHDNYTALAVGCADARLPLWRGDGRQETGDGIEASDVLPFEGDGARRAGGLRRQLIIVAVVLLLLLAGGVAADALWQHYRIAEVDALVLAAAHSPDRSEALALLREAKGQLRQVSPRWVADRRGALEQRIAALESRLAPLSPTPRPPSRPELHGEEKSGDGQTGAETRATQPPPSQEGSSGEREAERPRDKPPPAARDDGRVPREGKGREGQNSTPPESTDRRQ